MDDRDEHETQRHGLLQAAMDAFLDGTRAVVDLVGSAGTGAVEAMPAAVPATVTRMLASLQQLLDQAPPITAELDVLVQEVHAKRLSIQALQAELAALDNQLDILERSLAPLQTWTHQWSRLRQALTETLRSSGATESQDLSS